MFKGKKTANKRRRSVREEYPKTKLLHVNKNASKESSKLTDKSSFGESFEQLQELQSSILSAIPHAVVGLKDRSIFFANEAVERVFGWKPDEIIGQKTQLLYRSEKDYEEIGRHFYPLLEKQRTHAEDFPCRRKDGQEILCRISASVIGKEMSDKGIVLMYEDITRRKQTEAELEKYRLHLEDLVNERTADLKEKTNELEQSQKALRLLLEDMNKATKELETANERLKELDRLKSMFIASMSHELRTPLNSIIGFTGMTLQGLSGALNDEQKDNLARVYQSAKHLLSLITDVIDISKIEAGRIDSFPEEVSLQNIIDEAMATVAPLLKEKRLTLAVDMPEDVKLNTDGKRLLQCLINLLSNGVKYTEKGGITITASECAADMEISVTDTGIGIAEKDMPKLFEAFERLDTHLRVKAGGTGLGLYLTKKLTTDILQGSISVQSVEGQGSTFTLRVPRDLPQTGATKT